MIHPDDSADPDDTIYPDDPFKTIEIDETTEADPFQTIEIDETGGVDEQGDERETMDIRQHPGRDAEVRPEADAADQEVHVEEDEFLTIHPGDDVEPISEESSDPHDTWEPE